MSIVAGNVLGYLDRSTAAEAQISPPGAVAGSHGVVWDSKSGPRELLVLESPAGSFAVETSIRSAGARSETEERP